MKKTWIAVVLFSILALSGCGSSVESVKKTDGDAPVKKEEPVDTPEDAVDEPDEDVVYTIGDRITFDDLYALTIVSVKETEERNEFSEKEVEQVLLIEYLYENLRSEDEIYISDMEFKMVDEGGNMMDTYPVDSGFSPVYTPMGAKTLASFAVGTTEKSSKIEVHYYDNFFSSQSDFVFSLPVGSEVEVNLNGTLPEYENTYSVGETIEITTEDGVYSVTIDSVEKTSERNEYEAKKPEAVYKIAYSYANVSMEEPVYISEYSFTLIDEQGNTGYVYPNFSDEYPSETIKGAKSKAVMFFGTHKDSGSLVLAFKDNMFNSNSDFYIRADNLN